MKRIPLRPSFGQEKDLASIFDAGLFPLEKAADFKSLYDQFKKDHPKADHYPYAYVLDGTSKSSDDGEPGGSAGRPLASLLEEAGVDGCLIVARYFGGSKLGIPRLRRAFLSAGKKALEEAFIGVEKTVYVYELEVSYSDYETVRNAAKRNSFSIEATEFSLNVRAQIKSSDRLEGLGEKVGLLHLVLPEPELKTSYEEETHDPFQ